MKARVPSPKKPPGEGEKDMKRQALRKLWRILYDRWESVNKEYQTTVWLAVNGNQVVSSHVSGRVVIASHIRWREICDSVGIKRREGVGERQFDHDGEVLDDTVVITDPALLNTWLEMPLDTAMKILAVGFP